MINFFAFSWVTHIYITFILGICVLAQSLAIMLNFYRHSLNTSHVFEILFEVSILCEILIFSFLHGEMINSYKNGFILEIGYEKIRALVLLLVVSLAIIICILKKTTLPLSVIPAAVISLPILEPILGNGFPWLFIAALIFFLGRSVKVCISSVIALTTNLSALSVINAVDTLHTGVLFCENDGHILLSNYQMQNLMIAITGKVFRNAMELYDMIVSGKYESRYKKVELDGQLVYILNDGTAWMFTKTSIPFRMKNYVHISFSDVSELWELTAKLRLQNQKLKKRSDELKKTISNLHILSKEKEIENAKSRAHDILGQRLTVLLRTVQTKHDLNYDLLLSLSKGLLAELKAEQNEIGPYDKLKSIQQIFAAIGVDIEFEGQLPYNEEHACLFIDIIREGSTNAVRHGLATQINIKVDSTENACNLTINNNGHTTNNPIIPGNGIELMRRKVDAQGGNLNISHHPLFTLSVVLPGGD